MTLSKQQADAVLNLALQAGNAVMDIYRKDFSVEYKDDRSPLTDADRAANALITHGLRELFPDVPLISEENKQIDYAIRKNWKQCFIVDPIDGTKEFIKKNDQFTINIALAVEGEPVFGVVHAPALHETFIGWKEEGSFRVHSSGLWERLEPSPEHYSLKNEVKVVASKSHLTDETIAFVNELEKRGVKVTFSSSGSSLKLCRVAEGKADVYPRFGPTMEWDTAAAHAVALHAGKQVNEYPSRKPLRYNKENLLNPFFIVE